MYVILSDNLASVSFQTTLGRSVTILQQTVEGTELGHGQEKLF